MGAGAGPVTAGLLRQLRAGDSSASGELMPLILAELHGLARMYMVAEGTAHTLQPTALVNEAYLRLVGDQARDWQDRAHFIGVAASVMKRILIDHARRKRAAKRDASNQPPEAGPLSWLDAEEILDLNDALERLGEMSPRQKQIVEMRYFGGLSLEETAEAMQISAITVRRDWVAARAWLKSQLRPEIRLMTGMTPTKWEQIVELFHSTRERPIEEWQAILDSACGDDRDFRTAVETLLREDNAASGFLSKPAVEKLKVAGGAIEITEGQQFGKYRTVRLLGRGGMGQVWAAHDDELQRMVALKFISERTVGGVAMGQITREARTASALNHPNIITIYEVVSFGETPMIAMEYVDGAALRTLAKSPQSARTILDIAGQTAAALMAAHGVGIVHQDVKPENLLMRQDGYVKVLDFGLARHLKDETGFEAHPPAGTLRYMSPEQLRGELATPASDVFSLGVVLYELAAGHHPFAGGSAMDVVRTMLHAKSPPPRLNRKFPEELNALILAMLSNSAAARPAMAEVARVVETLKRPPGISRVTKLVWTAFALVCIVVLASWYWRRTGEASKGKWRQATSELPENRLTAAAISPDGKFFLYADANGLSLNEIGTGNARNLNFPPDVAVDQLAWFPDGKRFLMNVTSRITNVPSVWMLSIEGATPRKVALGCRGTPSPTGKYIAFTSIDQSEVWMARDDGSEPQRLLGGYPNETFPVIFFFPGDHLLGFQRRSYSSKIRPETATRKLKYDYFYDRSYEVLDVNSRKITAAIPEMWMESAAALANGGLLFQRRFPAGNSTADELWQVDTDPKTGAFSSRPHLVTGVGNQFSADDHISQMTATRDGKTAMVLRTVRRTTLYLGDFRMNDATVSHVRRFTLDEGNNYSHSWTVDSRAVLLESNRNKGRTDSDIFKQDLDQKFPDIVYASPGLKSLEQATPDGKWVLFAWCPLNGDYSNQNLARVAPNGGQAEKVPIDGPLDEFRCPLLPGNTCVLRKTIGHDQFVFFALDPLSGQGKELARTPWSPGIHYD